MQDGRVYLRCFGLEWKDRRDRKVTCPDHITTSLAVNGAAETLGTEAMLSFTFSAGGAAHSHCHHGAQ